VKIHTTKKELTLAEISQLITAVNSQVRRILKLKHYYRGEHDILRKRRRSDSAPNNVLVSNFCEYITNMSTGFFLGQPVAYSSLSKNEEEVDALMEIFKYNDEAAHNLELAEEASVTGEAYELLYLDKDAEVRFSSIPAEQVIMVCDDSLEENVILAIRYYSVPNLDQVTKDEFVDVYTSTTVTHYSYNGGNFQTLYGPIPHYIGDVPIVEYENNQGHKGDFEGVITLVDAYNKAQSLTLDDMEDFTDCYLVLKGMEGTTPEDVKELRKDKVLSLGEGGTADWLIKNINDTYVENVKTRLQKDIHKFSNIPDMSDESFTGNTSGVAIKYKLIGLEQIRSRKERGFKKGLQRRIELIAGIMKLREKTPIDFRDIEITFTANIPANVQEQAQIVGLLDGFVSRKRLLSLLPFVTDPKEEMEELEKEQEEKVADDYDEFGKHEHKAEEDVADEG